jgi:hypothetical protein
MQGPRTRVMSCRIDTLPSSDLLQHVSNSPDPRVDQHQFEIDDARSVIVRTDEEESKQDHCSAFAPQQTGGTGLTARWTKSNDSSNRISRIWSNILVCFLPLPLSVSLCLSLSLSFASRPSIKFRPMSPSAVQTQRPPTRLPRALFHPPSNDDSSIRSTRK